MKKFGFLFATLLSVAGLVGCTSGNTNNNSSTGGSGNSTGETTVVDPSENYGAFGLTCGTNTKYTFDEETSTYTITMIDTSISDDLEVTVTGKLLGKIMFDSSLTNNSAKIFLQNAYIYNESGPALYWQSSSKKLKVSAKADTINYVIEGSHDLQVVNNEEETSAAILSENNVEIQGGGILHVSSLTKHAVKGSDITMSNTGTVYLEAKNDGLHGKSVSVVSGNVNINNCSDGIQAEFNSSNVKGTFTMTGGTITFTGCKNCITCDGLINVNGTSETSLAVIYMNTYKNSTMSSATQSGITIGTYASVSANGSTFVY